MICVIQDYISTSFTIQANDAVGITVPAALHAEIVIDFKVSFLLTESGDFLVTESGGKIII